MPNLVGIGLSQVPTNSMLGGLAYQDPEHASIKDLDLKNLSQINSEISDTATDIFVYDTRKDSDGGAWRKRTQHTSWYNETLNTSTRGSRKEFPAVAVIVADSTSDKITIYDGDDPDLPMWMVISGANPRGIIGWATANITSIKVTALNGILVVGTNDSGTIFKFVEDFVDIMYSTANYKIKSSRTIAGRNDTPSYDTVSGTASRVFVIITYIINDVAMTVLPNAPIDDATGLPVPTIAVACGTLGAANGGVSVIKDDGTVVDIGVTTGAGGYASYNVAFGSNNELIHTQAYDYYYPSINIFDIIPTSDLGTTTTHATARSYPYVNSIPNIRGTSGIARPTLKYVSNSSGGDIAFGLQDTNPKLSLLSDNKEAGTDATKSMVAYIVSDYNSGWMHGDIKGAFLSDTDTTSLSGSELVTNGTFDSDISGWTIDQGTSVYNSGQLQFTGTSGNAVQQNATTVVGRKYIMKATVTNTANVGTNIGIEVGDDNNLVYVASNTITTGTKTFIRVYTATSTSTQVRLWGGTGATGYWDNVSLKEADPDRSINGGYQSATNGGKGLEVFGTITKSAVATGADLVSYGPFSTSNRLRQPYNSDLNFGTNDFSIMLWMYNTGTNTHQTLVGRDNREFSVDILDNSNYDRKFRIYGYNSSNSMGSFDSNADPFPLNTWSHVCVNYTGGNTVAIYVNGVLNKSGTLNYDIDDTSNGLNIGARNTSGSYAHAADGTKLALVRISKSAPSAEQIKKIYEDEKVLFQENAKATLYGSSDAVTALGYDEDTELLHVGTSAGRSDFQGLCRINNTTTAVTTAISASDDLIAEQ